MTLAIRRVVTGHAADGRAVVAIDEVAANVISRRPGHESCVVWSSETVPADNAAAGDGGLRDVGTCHAAGTIFRIVSYGPGVAPRMHRTLTVDYAVVMAGEIVMRLDDSEVLLRTGDVLVQRGTIHDWVNRGDVPCVIAFVLVAAHPAVVDGTALPVVG